MKVFILLMQIHFNLLQEL